MCVAGVQFLLTPPGAVYEKVDCFLLDKDVLCKIMDYCTGQTFFKRASKFRKKLIKKINNLKNGLSAVYLLNLYLYIN